MINKNIEAILKDANIAVNNGDYDKAEKMAHEIITSLNTRRITRNSAFEDKIDSPEILEDEYFRAKVMITLSNTANRRGNFDSALVSADEALAIIEQYNLIDIKPKAWNVIGNVYQNLNSFDEALDYYEKSLSAYKELGEKVAVAGITGNIGNVYKSLRLYDKALDYYMKSLSAYEELGEKSGIARIMGNIGTVYNEIGSYDTALEYYTKALESRIELGEKLQIVTVTGNIGVLYANKKFKGYNAKQAEEFLLKALAIAEEIGAKLNLYDIYRYLANLYEHEKRWEEAHEHFKKFHDIKEEVQSEEAFKKAAQIEHQKQAAEREKEIAVARATADAKLNATTSLLHKVLPESIATRMINGEEEIADYFPQVSILFADISGFTPISAAMPAYMVVRFLNHVFGEFDRIIKHHKCEKIKTIGDGYMAVAGAPIECIDHAERITAAAFEMQQAIQLPEEFREYLPHGTKFGIRIGLHTGSVVGGVIGDERFVYDIYSDSVNTAARMESHGKPNKIHVSEAFRNALISTSLSELPIQFIPRGEMDIKGKGIMKTYFLEKVKK
ncbi:MAG: tetratricopeptide repeat protein [Bacteroidetes bacterium]|nr:tetratricopeptide repeat protein [Bacteroidota bacterium]